MRRRLDGWWIAKVVILAMFTITSLVPVLYMVSLSVRRTSEMFATLIIPKSIQLSNYVEAWKSADFPRLFGNSIIVTGGSVLITVGLALLAGYAFARLRFTGSRGLYYMFLLGMTIPVQVCLVPLFMTLRKFHLLSTYYGIGGVYVAFGLPFATFILTGFFRTLPHELEDAAKIDGCSTFGAFRRIMLPLAKPGIATVSIFLSAYYWNEFVLAVTFLQKESVHTVPVGLQVFYGQYFTYYNLLAAALTISMLPVVAIYLVFQKQFVRGLTAGAIKG